METLFTWVIQHGYHWIIQYGYIGLFFLLMLGIIGIPIPDEALLTFAGYLIYKGDLQPIPTVLASSFGSICGISVSYGLGRTAGFYVIEQYGSFAHLTPEKMARAHNWFDRTGRWSLLFGYFIPGVRHLTALAAGTSKLQFPVFALFAYTGGFIWSTTFISVGYVLGERWAHVSERIHHTLVLGAYVVVGLLLLYVLVRRLKQKRT